MKGFCCKITQNKMLRWITSVAVLFYVLIPSIGTCHCSCCQHTAQASPLVADTEISNVDTVHISETKTCCCSKSESINESTMTLSARELPEGLQKSCCRSKEKTRESGTCPCLKAADVSPFVLEVVVPVSSLQDELKSFSPYLFVFLGQPDSSLFAFPDKLPVNSMFCLSMRLHLLLNVLRN